jgi:hypothetical protein
LGHLPNPIARTHPFFAPFYLSRFASRSFRQLTLGKKSELTLLRQHTLV